MSSQDYMDGDFAADYEYLPSESQLTLFCLDYLRDLRRTYVDPQDMLDAEGLHADWLTLAIYALSRSFSMQGPLKTSSGKKKDNDPVNYNQVTMPVFNDSWMDSHRVLTEASPMEQEEMMNPTNSPFEDFSNLPSLPEMTKQILLSTNPHDEADGDDEKKVADGSPFLDSYTWYDYDDSHPSNANRFFLLDGLSGSVNGRGPLLLGEVAAAGLCQLQAKARLVAEDKMVHTPLFEQFVRAVESKGFFQDPEHEKPRSDPQQEEERLVLQKAVHDERMGKVVSKFRSKLASRMEMAQNVDESTYVADLHHSRRMKRLVIARKLNDGEIKLSTTTSTLKPPVQQQVPPAIEQVDSGFSEALAQAEAEKLKSKGNSHMQKKHYDEALECYTQALRLSPSGPLSHVYFSNRAAALLSMKMFDQAILDSERALALAPTYGKAHARLGLAHFLLGDYRRALEAYTVALKYEPDNKSSKSYMEKAAKKLAAFGSPDVPDGAMASYSVVSEWQKTNTATQANTTAPTRGKREKREPSDQRLELPDLSTDVAEKHKTLGNTQMANREYQAALESYSTAIELSPDGPQSHVYYSNRAAALCYLEQYEEAVQDSEVAIYLKPTYGKAHARLGLSQFFLGDLEGSINAYETALQYDPNNAANKSFLAKARLKLERMQKEQELASFDVSNEARRLMADPDMMLMAKKMMRNGNGTINEQDLLTDPELKKFTMKAMNDPTILEAFQNLQQVNHNNH
mmetsp:Transcript_9599/g.28658  ORF Transcript_9599/g.28658 Transcript_9599/m.28658 type:complete len:742 (+) Transcript_9599:252-2477(+)